MASTLEARSLRTAVLATTVAAAVIAPAAAASAASTTVTDATGDVWESTYDDATETFTASGSVTNVDLVGTTVSHGTARVKVTMQYADLKKSGAVFSSSIQMRLDNGPHTHLYLDNGATAGHAYVGWAKRLRRD